VSERRVAFVTGASRGIGAASAVALAAVGFDIVATARTLREGHSADGRALPGSLETTARAVREQGREALELRLDLLDPDSIEAAVAETLETWGTIDLLLNNGIYTGSGSMERFLDLEPETIRTMFEANVFAQISLTQRVLPGMLDHGYGTLINMVSGAGIGDPPAPAGKGGWGFAYAATKAAFHRMVGVLAVEHPNSGVAFHNLEPGFVMTEAMRLNDPEGEISKRFNPAPPEVPAALVAWLATDSAAREWNGKTVFAQKLALELKLHPDWRT
jgi:NAD(P)-dependent dehydrogenase (short-subunit alcohol dehydrogenase family)